MIDQFKSPLVLLLIVACILSATFGERIEAVAIAAILILNALIGFFQEYRAESAILALQKMTAPRAKVMRDGKQSLILARDVVPGDLLLLEAGDIVAADGRVLAAAHCQIIEAILTGESSPVEKMPLQKPSRPQDERIDNVFMGSAVVTGTASAEVTGTGMKTELGRIAHLIASAQSEPTPLSDSTRTGRKTTSYTLRACRMLGRNRWPTARTTMA